MGGLPLAGADPQLLAAVIAIRAARGGVGNFTGQDLQALRLTDAAAAVAAVVALGWHPQGDLLTGDPKTPVTVSVPELADESDPKLPLGKQMRTRISGWTTRTLAAKPLKKASPAARLAALFLAAHSSRDRCGVLSTDLPEHCRAALPELLATGFLLEVDDTVYRLAETVRHLAGQYGSSHNDMPDEGVPAKVLAQAASDPLRWDVWKDQASVALRRHVEAVESCRLCKVRPDRVAEAFMSNVVPTQIWSKTLSAYGLWKCSQPDRGPRAAQWAADFRAAHGHGPSVKQLCDGLGWGQQNRDLRNFIVQRLIANEWLTNTGPVPWTLRPGKAAQTVTSAAAPAVPGGWSDQGVR
ncbi:hypothetical protein [Streptomyces sp. H39-C1]|uniref:hypothetical protein n=1 Tax=Streptomyces sp. H39-C1 TaxID=3004355 RepID=UPI0022AFCDF4|nr:hypothetical protein [Streptomyces sp. H39-C1]MCZ4101083.1 hypothetical protein [Streptomyces sp. H39-C1]